MRGILLVGVAFSMGENPDMLDSFHKKRFSMKKVLAVGMLAVCLIAASRQEVSAWSNHRFSIGLNWERQSGGTNFGWGAFHNGQPPGPEFFHGGPSFWNYHEFVPPVSTHHAQGSYAMPTSEPAYAQPSMMYTAPYQFATYPHPVYYYPYYYGR